MVGDTGIGRRAGVNSGGAYRSYTGGGVVLVVFVVLVRDTSPIVVQLGVATVYVLAMVSKTGTGKCTNPGTAGVGKGNWDGTTNYHNTNDVIVPCYLRITLPIT